MAGFMPALLTGAGSAAGSMAANKAGNALFPQEHGGIAPPQQMQAHSPALTILQALQQQMQQQEQQRQQAIMAMLMQPAPGAVQMESRNG